MVEAKAMAGVLDMVRHISALYDGSRCASLSDNPANYKWVPKTNSDFVASVDAVSKLFTTLSPEVLLNLVPKSFPAYARAVLETGYKSKLKDDIDSLVTLATMQYLHGPDKLVELPANGEVNVGELVKSAGQGFAKMMKEDYRQIILKADTNGTIKTDDLNHKQLRLLETLTLNKALAYDKTSQTFRIESFYEESPLVLPAAEVSDEVLAKGLQEYSEGLPEKGVNYVKFILNQDGLIDENNDFLLKTIDKIAEEAGYDKDRLGSPDLNIEGEAKFAGKLQKLSKIKLSKNAPEIVKNYFTQSLEEYNEALKSLSVNPDALGKEQFLTAIWNPNSLPRYKFGEVLEFLKKKELISYDEGSKTYAPKPVKVGKKNVGWFSDLKKLSEIFGELDGNILSEVLTAFAGKRAVFNDMPREYNDVYDSWTKPIQDEMSRLNKLEKSKQGDLKRLEELDTQKKEELNELGEQEEEIENYVEPEAKVKTKETDDKFKLIATNFEMYVDSGYNEKYKGPFGELPTAVTVKSEVLGGKYVDLPLKTPKRVFELVNERYKDLDAQLELFGIYSENAYLHVTDTDVENFLEGYKSAISKKIEAMQEELAGVDVSVLLAGSITDSEKGRYNSRLKQMKDNGLLGKDYSRVEVDGVPVFSPGTEPVDKKNRHNLKKLINIQTTLANFNHIYKEPEGLYWGNKIKEAIKSNMDTFISEIITPSTSTKMPKWVIYSETDYTVKFEFEDGQVVPLGVKSAFEAIKKSSTAENFDNRIAEYKNKLEKYIDIFKKAVEDEVGQKRLRKKVVSFDGNEYGETQFINTYMEYELDTYFTRMKEDMDNRVKKRGAAVKEEETKTPEVPTEKTIVFTKTVKKKGTIPVSKDKDLDKLSSRIENYIDKKEETDKKRKTKEEADKEEEALDASG